MIYHEWSRDLSCETFFHQLLISYSHHEGSLFSQIGVGDVAAITTEA
jgi:hypothetical protein